MSEIFIIKQLLSEDHANICVQRISQSLHIVSAWPKIVILPNLWVPDERDLRFASTVSNYNSRNTQCIPVVIIFVFPRSKSGIFDLILGKPLIFVQTLHIVSTLPRCKWKVYVKKYHSFRMTLFYLLVIFCPIQHPALLGAWIQNRGGVQQAVEEIALRPLKRDFGTCISKV